jgi:Mannose-6-phosphate isomerase
VTVNDDVKTLHENESIYIPIDAVHRLENPGKILLELIEVEVISAKTTLSASRMSTTGASAAAAVAHGHIIRVVSAILPPSSLPQRSAGPGGAAGLVRASRRFVRRRLIECDGSRRQSYSRHGNIVECPRATECWGPWGLGYLGLDIVYCITSA